MDSLPLTRPAPWTEIPETAGMEPLFTEVTPVAVRMFQLTVTLPDGERRWPAMDVLTWQGQAVEDFAKVLGYALQAGDFEINFRPYDG